MPPGVIAFLSFLGLTVVATKGLADHLQHENKGREHENRIRELEGQVTHLASTNAWYTQTAAEAQEQLRGLKSLLRIRRDEIDALRLKLEGPQEKVEVPAHDGEDDEGA